MKTTTIEMPSSYAKNGKIEVEELSIKTELDSSHDICYLIYGKNKAEKALMYQSRNIDDVLGKMNDFMLYLLNRQVFKLNAMAKEME